jgi:hypothetical protein
MALSCPISELHDACRVAKAHGDSRDLRLAQRIICVWEAGRLGWRFWNNCRPSGRGAANQTTSGLVVLLELRSRECGGGASSVRVDPRLVQCEKSGDIWYRCWMILRDERRW